MTNFNDLNFFFYGYFYLTLILIRLNIGKLSRRDSMITWECTRNHCPLTTLTPNVAHLPCHPSSCPIRTLLRWSSAIAPPINRATSKLSTACTSRSLTCVTQLQTRVLLPAELYGLTDTRTLSEECLVRVSRAEE